jgi:hypothetical protein
MNCLVCATPDKDKPMVFRGEEWCSDNHRKVVNMELIPTHDELITMDRALYDQWKKRGAV